MTMKRIKYSNDRPTRADVAGTTGGLSLTKDINFVIASLATQANLDWNTFRLTVTPSVMFDDDLEIRAEILTFELED